MGNYILAFGVYTLAMIGVIFLAFIVWKNSVLNNSRGTSASMKVEEMLSLNSRKSIYIIRVKNERFLIAADVERTTLLAKLGDGAPSQIPELSRSDIVQEVIAQKNEQLGEPLGQRAVMRNILKELTGKNK